MGIIGWIREEVEDVVEWGEDFVDSITGDEVKRKKGKK